MGIGFSLSYPWINEIGLKLMRILHEFSNQKFTNPDHINELDFESLKLDDFTELKQLGIFKR